MSQMRSVLSFRKQKKNVDHDIFKSNSIAQFINRAYEFIMTHPGTVFYTNTFTVY